jgi:hypothetical protein
MVPVKESRLVNVGVVGVPVMAPVLLLRLNPAGRLPEATVQFTGGVPPLSPMLVLYAWLTRPLGSVAVVIVGGALMVTV